MMIKITFPNGKIIKEEGTKAMVDAILYIGVEKVYELDLRTFKNYELLTKEPIQSEKKLNQIKVGDYLLTHGQQNVYKVKLLQTISARLGLGMIVELIES